MDLTPKELSPIIHAACETIGISIEEAFSLISSSKEISNLNRLPLNVWIKFCNLIFMPYEFIYNGYSKEIHINEIKKNVHRIQNSKLPLTNELRRIIEIKE